MLLRSDASNPDLAGFRNPGEALLSTFIMLMVGEVDQNVFDESRNPILIKFMYGTV